MIMENSVNSVQPLRRIIFSVLDCWFSQLFIIYKDYNESLLIFFAIKI